MSAPALELLGPPGPEVKSHDELLLDTLDTLNVVPCVACGRKVNAVAAIWWHAPWAFREARMVNGMCGKVTTVALHPRCLTRPIWGGRTYASSLNPAPKGVVAIYRKPDPERFVDEWARRRAPSVILFVVTALLVWALNQVGTLWG